MTYVGRSLDGMPLPERRALTGRWAAFEIYTPEKTPMRIIEAEGDSAAACLEALRARGLDPSKFEIVLIGPPY